MIQPQSFCLTIADEHDLLAQTERAFDLVWRVAFDAPGFAVLDLGEVDSRTLRRFMVALKKRLSEISVSRCGQTFSYRSMARFDQQVTTRFHLDGAPEQSLLILGYEPSEVVSRLFLADFSRAAFDTGLTPTQFLDQYHPMYRTGEEMLAPYVTEVPQPTPGHARIVLINNSSLPFDSRRAHSLGVLHKAEIVSPDEALSRVINSTMLALGGDDQFSEAQPQEFVVTDSIARKSY